jgi:hypothetical protein
VRHVQLAQRLYQAEAGRLVIGKPVALDDFAAIAGEPDLRGLVDEVTDGKHETILADHCAVAAALGPETGGRVAIGRDFRTHQDHRIERTREVELDLVGPRLQRFREGPLLDF